MGPPSQLREQGSAIEPRVFDHAPILENRDLRWADEAECAASAAALAQRPALRNASIELLGSLGVGKTAFVRHLLHALGVHGHIKSPTYALMEPYALADAAAAAGVWNIWHFDFYRFDDAQEWEDAGFREIYASPGLKLAEWPEKAAGLLPEPDLRIAIESDADERRHVRFTAHTARGVELLP